MQEGAPGVATRMNRRTVFSSRARTKETSAEACVRSNRRDTKTDRGFCTPGYSKAHFRDFRAELANLPRTCNHRDADLTHKRGDVAGSPAPSRASTVRLIRSTHTPQALHHYGCVRRHKRWLHRRHRAYRCHPLHEVWTRQLRLTRAKRKQRVQAEPP